MKKIYTLNSIVDSIKQLYGISRSTLVEIVNLDIDSTEANPVLKLEFKEVYWKWLNPDAKVGFDIVGKNYKSFLDELEKDRPNYAEVYLGPKSNQILAVKPVKFVGELNMEVGLNF